MYGLEVVSEEGIQELIIMFSDSPNFLKYFLRAPFISYHVFINGPFSFIKVSGGWLVDNSRILEH